MKNECKCRGVQRFQLRKYAKQVINCSAAEILKELQEAVIGVDNGEIECSRFIHADTHEEKKQEENRQCCLEKLNSEERGERCRISSFGGISRRRATTTIAPDYSSAESKSS